jgi:hypothetical protein
MTAPTVPAAVSHSAVNNWHHEIGEHGFTDGILTKAKPGEVQFLD